MPTLQFKGKNIIWNHHLSVPYHTLEEVPELHYQPEQGEGNLIIEGDNLLALKALLPQYAGKVKCIYIDPPYNTGKGSGVWVYNDEVNSPMIKEWLGEVVDESDLTKSDKWLCMMTPRIKLLRELLDSEGLLFVSIDEYEIHNCKTLLNEIFGEENRLSSLIWDLGTGTSAGHFTRSHEYILCYAKDKKRVPNFSGGEGIIDERAVKKISAKNKNKAYLFKKGTKWEAPEGMELSGTWGGDESMTLIDGSMICENQSLKYDVVIEAGYTQKDQMDSFFNGYETFDSKGQKVIEFYFRDNGKIYSRKDRSIINPPSVIRNLASTKTGTAELKKLFSNEVFDFPKSTLLIKYIISLSTNKDELILDSFAGSGTTMHAINELNKEDGGNRKCILVQMTEKSDIEPNKNICRDITTERNKRAIDKYEYNTGFKYLKVGPAIDPDTMLDGNLPTYQHFAEYVYYLATGSHLETKADIDPTTHFVGNAGSKAIYLIYEQDIEILSSMALTLHLAEDIIKDSPGKRRLIYAPACFLDEEYMSAMQIEFVSIPYNLFEKRQ